MHSSLACPHFSPALDSTLTRKPIVTLQRRWPLIKMQSSMSYPQSSALKSHINKEIELSQRVMHARVAEVAPMRDREVLFVAPRPQPTQPSGTAIPGAKLACPLPVRFLAYLVLFLCCASPLHADGNTESTQQHYSQPQGPVQSQASSVRTRPAAPSSSMTPTASDIHSAVPVAATGQSRLLPLRTRFVLFLCCTSPPHADGH